MITRVQYTDTVMSLEESNIQFIMMTYVVLIVCFDQKYFYRQGSWMLEHDGCMIGYRLSCRILIWYDGQGCSVEYKSSTLMEINSVTDD